MSEVDYAAIKKAMDEHLNPKPSEVMERCHLNMASQGSSETVTDFAAQLKKLTLECNFKSNLENALKDQFVCRLKSHDTRVNLFNKEKLPFEEAFK